MEKLSHKNAKLLADNPKVLTLFDDIEFETEEETEKFISETIKKDIEIKMEIPTAPEEDPSEIEIQEEEENPEQQSYEEIKEHNNQVMANWHARCSMAGLLPKEFELLPEDENIEEEIKLEDKYEKTPDMETYKDEIEIEDKDEIKIDKSVYDNEIKIKDKKSFLEPEIPKKKKKSFHRRRKEEWKKKTSSRQFLVTVTERKEDEEVKERKKKNNIFSNFKVGPPDIIKITLVTLLACALIPLSTANPVDPNGYRPSATRTDFHDAQHNPKLIDHIRDLNYINTTISTIHADHVGVQTFVHEVKFIIDDVENGVDQSCQAIMLQRR